MLRRFLTLCFCLLNLLFVSGTLAQVNTKATLVYGIPHYPPYSVVNKDSYSGRDVELIHLLSLKLGVNIQFAACEWIRCLELAKAGKVDVLTSVSYAPERETYLHFIQPAYSVGSIVFWVRKGEANRLTQYNDLLTLNVGKEKAARLYKRVDENPNIRIYESPNYQVLLKMLASNRLDTVMGGDVVLDLAIAGSPYADVLEKAVFEHKVPSTYLGLARNSPKANQWLPRFQQQMQAMMHNGELDYFVTWRAASEKAKQRAH